MGLKGEFIIKKNGELLVYHDYDDIPDSFDHVISFKPTVPDAPHGIDEHAEIDTWNEKLKRLMEIEYASSNKKR